MNKKKKSRWSLIWTYVIPCLPLFITAMACSVGSTVCQSLIPQVIRVGVDGILGGDTEKIPGFVLRFLSPETLSDVSRMLFICALVILIVAAVNIAVSYGARVLTTKGSEKFVKSLRDSLFDHIEHLPFAWFVKNPTGDIIQRCTSDVDMVRSFVTQQLLEVIRIVFLIVFYMAIMLRMNVKISLIAISFLPIVVLYSGYFFQKIAKHFREADEAEGVLSAMVQENLTGVRVVRAFGREPFEREKFDEKNNRFAGLWIYIGKFLSLYWSVGDLITGIQVLIVTCVGISAVVNGSLTVGEYITFISYNASLSWPIRSLGRIVSEMSKAGVSIDRLAYILEAEEERDVPDAVCPSMDQDIVFDHVTFAYEEGGAVLKDVSFTIPAGKTFAILGGTGSGKSTMMHLLDRLYTLPEGSGTISIGGVDIRKIKADHLRKNIGMVLQEPFLYSGTIRENIGITRTVPSLENIRQACEIACVDNAIDSFTDGYETIVGERGVTLSGGQKQRVAIARMLMQEAPVMIFDDSLSAVDAETDAKIRAALHKRMGSATTILIAHRVTTLMQADMILVFDNGKVAEMGTHEELLAHENGIYHRIYDIQMSTGSKGGEE